MKKFNRSEMSLTDLLAEDRTKLANDRTLLAYFRTTIVLLSSGIGIINLSILSEIKELGWGLVILSPLVMSFGAIHFVRFKRRIKKYCISND